MLAQLPPALQKLQLPLRLRLWDGHEFSFGPTPSVTIVVKDPALVLSSPTPALISSVAHLLKDASNWRGPLAKSYAYVMN